MGNIYIGEASEKFQIKDDILQENTRQDARPRRWKILHRTGEWMILGQMGELQTANAKYLIHYSYKIPVVTVPKDNAPNSVKVVFNLLK